MEAFHTYLPHGSSDAGWVVMSPVAARIRVLVACEQDRFQHHLDLAHPSSALCLASPATAKQSQRRRISNVIIAEDRQRRGKRPGNASRACVKTADWHISAALTMRNHGSGASAGVPAWHRSVRRNTRQRIAGASSTDHNHSAVSMSSDMLLTAGIVVGVAVAEIKTSSANCH
jgi:hypothetical protein